MDYRERWELKDYLFGQVIERRILLVHLVLTLVVLAFVLDFWNLQGVHGDEYRVLAENNRLRRIPLPPTRGEILDRDHRVIASTRPSLDLLLRPDDRPSVERQIEGLAALLGEPADDLRRKLTGMRAGPGFDPLPVKEDVTLSEVARIEVRRERFPSIEVRQTARRHYPEGALVAHAIGYVGEVNEARLQSAEDPSTLFRGDIVGKSGVERAYDDALRGVRGWMVASVDSVGRQMGEAQVLAQPGHGSPLEITLDMRLQRTLVEALGPEAGAGVFLDPKTGEVLALASAPAFDPNRFADGLTREAWQALNADPGRPLHARAIASFYAPGSTFKIVMAIAGLETGTIRPSDALFCAGSTVIYGHRRLCWKRGGHGRVELVSALAQSCNVYFYHLGQRLGIEPIHRYGSMLGLGAPTGIDIPGEEGAILPSPEWKQRAQREPWYPGDTISVAIGQGLLAVTPVQMATMVSAVATGRVPRPHLVRGSVAPGREIAVTASTLDVVRRGLEQVVAAGTGRSATRGGFTVAGKTGTAQVYKRSAGIDADELPKAERDHAWFVGYAPVDSPRIAFAVVVEHGGHGGTSAAPIARRVLEVFFGPQEDGVAPEEPGLQARRRPRAGDDGDRATAAP
jgi:penicillin-binding protein 2